MQLTEPQLSSLALTRGGKKVREPSFSSPSQMVTFIVEDGKEKETFLIHKEHAYKYSPVLDKAFNSVFKEGTTQTYKLEDTKPKTFRIFVKWLYSQKLTHIHHEGHDSKYGMFIPSDGHSNICNKQTKSHIELWVLAEKFLIPQLQNEIMDVLEIVSKDCVSTFELNVKYIYANTADNSALRRFIVNLIAWTAEIDDYKKYSHLYPYDFLLDVATVYNDAVPPRAAANRRNKTEVSDYYVVEDSS